MKPTEIRPGMLVVLMSSSRVMTVANFSDWRAFWGRPYVRCTWYGMCVDGGYDFYETWRFPEELGTPAVIKPGEAIEKAKTSSNA